MAKSEKYYYLKGTPRVEELCPKCWLPSLKTYTLIRIDMTGVTTLGTRVACRDHNEWMGAFVPAADEEKAE